MRSSRPQVIVVEGQEFLLGASAAAGAVPVRRATRVDPIVALRRD